MEATEPKSPGRRAAEVSFWIVLIGTLWTLDTVTKFGDRRRSGVGLDDFRLVAEQATSAMAALVMVAFVVFWVRRFPVLSRHPGRTSAAHLLGSALFATGHYGLIVLLRIVVYPFNGIRYVYWTNPIGNLVTEYQKDVKIYVGMVIVVSAYRYYRDHQSPSAAKGTTRKLVVQAGSGERLLELDDIEYLEAARNYVSVYTDGREHLVRKPLKDLLESLPESRFARTHRSFVVNVDKITRFKPTGSGGHTVVLSGGAEIPLGRTYRDRFRSRLAEL